MTRYFNMHIDNPQPRLINQAAEILKAGELIAYPTDSVYAFGCCLDSRKALDTIRRLRGLSEKHPMTLVCNSIAQAAEYCLIDDTAFRVLKMYTPGPYTFILQAKKTVPRPAQGIKRKVVGIRIPENNIALDLIDAIDAPILSSSLWLAKEPEPIVDPQQIPQRTSGYVNLVLDGGYKENKLTTIVDLVAGQPTVIRQGLGQFPE